MDFILSVFRLMAERKTLIYETLLQHIGISLTAVLFIALVGILFLLSSSMVCFLWLEIPMLE